MVTVVDRRLPYFVAGPKNAIKSVIILTVNRCNNKIMYSISLNDQSLSKKKLYKIINYWKDLVVLRKNGVFRPFNVFLVDKCIDKE